MKSFLLLGALLACALAVQDLSHLREGQEYVAMVKVPNPEDVFTLIERGISLDHPRKTDSTFEAYVTTRDAAILNELNLEYTLEENGRRRQGRSVEDDVVYHDYKKLTNFMSAISKQYPSITRLSSLGKSVEDRELWAIEITSDIESKAKFAKPQFKYIANMHGDEVVGRELSVYLIELLCSHYGTDDRLTRLVNNTDIFIVPTMNPDGFELDKRGNKNNVDLNRNFPDQFTDPENTKTKREPETIAIMNFIEQNNFVLSANFHGGAVVANYPYDGNADHRSGRISACPDNELFKYLAQTYSNTHRKMHNSREFQHGITNGAEWYVLYGGMQDWNYVYNQGVIEITIELSDIKWPNANQLASFWDDNREAMLSYMELVHVLGVRGSVTDSEGKPLAAVISIDGNARTIKTNPAHGDYYRLLLPGTYSITAKADDEKYKPKTAEIIIPEEQTAQIVYNFVLSA